MEIHWYSANRSTDNSLRRWNTLTNESTMSYTGHSNEKNFVGLSVSGDWISCGSEDNCVYAYHKDCKTPIASFNFPSTANPLEASIYLDKQCVGFVINSQFIYNSLLQMMVTEHLLVHHAGRVVQTRYWQPTAKELSRCSHWTDSSSLSNKDHSLWIRSHSFDSTLLQ